RKFQLGWEKRASTVAPGVASSAYTEIAQSRNTGASGLPSTCARFAEPLVCEFTSRYHNVPSVGPLRSAAYRRNDHTAPRVSRSSSDWSIPTGPCSAVESRYRRYRSAFCFMNVANDAAVELCVTAASRFCRGLRPEARKNTSSSATWL